MKLKNFLLLLLLFLPLTVAIAQEKLQLLRSFAIPEPVAVSSDGQGNILLSTAGGEIQKYNSNGELLNTYSPPTASYYTTLDGRAGMQVRAFDENNQQLVYLDRFLNQSGNMVDVPSDEFGFISALGWSMSGNLLWVFDATDQQLKKWDATQGRIITAIKLNPFFNRRMDVKKLFEHLHKLYLFTDVNILVMDQNGTYEKMMKVPEWKSVCFWGDALLFLTQANTLEFVPLYNEEKKPIQLEDNADIVHFNFIAAGKDKELFFLTRDTILVYQFVP